MELPEDTEWLHVEWSVFTFFIVLEELKMGNAASRIVGAAPYLELMTFLNKTKKRLEKPRGIQLL